jgi:hypothetical protein
MLQHKPYSSTGCIKTSNKTSKLEAAGLSHRAHRSAQGKPEIPASASLPVEQGGREEAALSGTAKHADRSHQLKLQLPESAIRSKPQRERISLRPTNRSPYDRRKSRARR